MLLDHLKLPNDLFLTTTSPLILTTTSVQVFDVGLTGSGHSIVVGEAPAAPHA